MIHIRRFKKFFQVCENGNTISQFTSFEEADEYRKFIKQQNCLKSKYSLSDIKIEGIKMNTIAIYTSLSFYKQVVYDKRIF